MFSRIAKSVFSHAAMVVFGTCVLALAGCEKTPPPEFRFNIVEWTKQEQMILAEGEHFDEGYKEEIGSLLTSLFGTPDEPKFPFLLGDQDPAHEIISFDNLKMAAGPTVVDRRTETSGLYREHCAHCHGVTGDGKGPTAAQLNPYPRDFRLGKFKFKATPLRRPPTNHDLRTVLESGVPGTAMPSFRTLPREQVDALIDYVKYLTIRGQYERYLISEVPNLEGASFIDLGLKSVSAEGEEPSEDAIEEFEDQMYGFIDEGLREGIVDRWLDLDVRATEVPAAPIEFDLTHPDHVDFVAKGRELFFTKGNCMQCHGDTGVGDGQISTYDDWTSDWKVGNVDFNNPDTFEAFTKVGVLAPRPILPRNLHHSVYRGGSHPSDLYLRIANGIEGTPMPASSAMNSEEIWAVVAYVRSIPFADREFESSRPVNEKQVGR